MQTANNTNNYTVEGLVAKYRTFVKENTPEWHWKLFDNYFDLVYNKPFLLSLSKEALEDEKRKIETDYPGSSADAEFINIVINELCRHEYKLKDYIERQMINSNADVQLIAILYRTVAGEKCNKYAMKVLSPYIESFSNKVLDTEEFDFLCCHFLEVISYEFSNKKDWIGTSPEELFYDLGVPLTRLSSELKDYLNTIEHSPQENSICIINDFDMSDFALLYPNAVFAGGGNFGLETALEQVRIFAEERITANTIPFSESVLLEKKSVDFIVFDALRVLEGRSDACEFIEPLYDSLKDGGKMIFLITRNDLTGKYGNDKMVDFFRRIVNERAIESMVLFNEDFHVSPGGWISYVDYFSIEKDQDNILISIEKKKHSKVRIESRKRNIVATVDANTLDASFLYPGYYLANRPSDGCPLSLLANPDGNIHNVSDDALVVATEHLSKDYQDAIVGFKILKTKSWYIKESKYHDSNIVAIDKPGVCLYINDNELFTGYIRELRGNKFARLEYILYLIPQKGIDVRYLSTLLLSAEVKQQIISLCDGQIDDYFLPKIIDRIIVPKHTPKQRIEFLAEANYEALLTIQQEMKKKHEIYKKAVRMRKHALTQSLSSIEAMFYALNAYRNRQDGKMSNDDIISRRIMTTVKDAFEFIGPKLKNMMYTLDRIADVEYSFDNASWINPEQFIEDYISQNESGWLNFKPVITWNKGDNLLKQNIIAPLTRELVARKGDPKSELFFSKDALKHILNNVVANAVSHGFTDTNRNDYQLRFSWHEEGTSIVVEVENNGTPIPSDRDTASLLEYGVSGALHKDGHNGIGCNEIDEIMRRYDGKVEIISTPNDEFTVKYILTFKSHILFTL